MTRDADMSNLAALVIQDLKDIGIKIVKAKKDADEGQNQCTGSGVFGKCLNQLPVVDVEESGLVPRFLVSIVSLIEKNVNFEGIFRKSGSVSRLKDLRAKVDAGEDISDACVLDLCSLFKQFFRDLPEPLLTTRLQESFISCYDLNSTQRASAVLLLCHLLPDHHLATLRFIANFLRRVAAHSDVNKMDAANISVCMTPNIFHERTSSKTMVAVDGESAKSAVVAPTCIVELLIELSDEIGIVDIDLQHRLVLMTTCFNDDDDAAYEELEITDNREKKRSGSFQGLISNLSSSFTKWRNKEKLNSSAVQFQPSSSSATSAASICPQVISDEYNQILSTPVLKLKRKAEDDPLPFSNGKKLAILRNMPQNAVLGSTPYVSSTKKGKMAESINSSAVIVPQTSTCKKLSHNYSVDDLSNVASEKHESTGAECNRLRRGISLDSSPVHCPQLPKNKVRKSFEGLIRRLSGGKDTQLNREKSEMLISQHRYRNESVQRSPSALSFNLTSSAHGNTGSLPITHQSRLSSSFSGGPTDTSANAIHWGGENLSRRPGVARQRSLSADGTSAANTSLRRGRPNTVQSGLPSPLHRRPSDVSYSKTNLLVEDNPGAASLIDTSPIVPDNTLGPQSINLDTTTKHQTLRELFDQNMEEVAVASPDANDAFDEAFIGSVLDCDDAMLFTDGVDLDQSESCKNDEQHSIMDCDAELENCQKLSSVVDKQSLMFKCRPRPRDPMERFVSVCDRQSNLSSSLSSSVGPKSVPKIKASLMANKINKRRLFTKISSPLLQVKTATGPFSSPVCAHHRRATDVNTDHA